MNIAVIGGGASGIMAAICAARLGASVTIYEKFDRIGKKLLATGNGRCNITNINACKDMYHGADTEALDNVFEKFNVSDTMDFFSETGLFLKTEPDGKVYPYCDRASAVLDVLRNELARLSIICETDFDVSEIIRRKDSFEIVSYDNRHIFADKVIFSAGGKASPGLCGGNGYGILKKLGHSCTQLKPAIVQLKTDNKNLKGLKGIKCRAKLTLGGYSESGELLFTESGLSGPPAFYLSSYYTEPENCFIDFFENTDEKELFVMLLRNSELFETAENLFTGILHKRIGISILKESGITEMSTKCSSLSKRDISQIAKTSKNFTALVSGTESWNNAQVTSGGIPLHEIDLDSFMSLIIPDLYITGEILDIDGNCGGYNLQWAWSTGYIAGNHAALMKGTY